MLENVRRLELVSYYAAPPTARVNPATIPAGRECIEVLTAGKIFFEVEGIEREYGRGAFFWHLGGEQTIWKTVPEAPYRCVVFNFSVEQRLRVAPKVSYWSLPEEGAAFAERCLKRFHAGIADNALFSAYTYSTLLWNASNQNVAVSLPIPLQNALRYIRGHWSEPLEAAEIAQASNISKPYLFRLFRENLQSSPYRYLLNLRINNAKFMLANKEKPIKEIAADCGFASLEVFYRQFRSLVKTSPAGYRKNFMPYNFK